MYNGFTRSKYSFIALFKTVFIYFFRLWVSYYLIWETHADQNYAKHIFTSLNVINLFQKYNMWAEASFHSYKHVFVECAFVCVWVSECVRKNVIHPYIHVIYPYNTSIPQNYKSQIYYILIFKFLFLRFLHVTKVWKVYMVQMLSVFDISYSLD